MVAQDRDHWHALEAYFIARVMRTAASKVAEVPRGRHMLRDTQEWTQGVQQNSRLEFTVSHGTPLDTTREHVALNLKDSEPSGAGQKHKFQWWPQSTAQFRRHARLPPPRTLIMLKARYKGSVASSVGDHR